MIAAQLREIAIYFDLDGDRHRAIAYDRAAKSIEAANGLQRLLDEGRLEELPAIGPSIARTVGDLARRGSATVLDNLRAKWPMVIVELAQLPYVGVIKARKIHEALAPHDLDAVAARVSRRRAARRSRASARPAKRRSSPRSRSAGTRGTRALHIDAEEHAMSIAQHLRADPAALRVEIAGPVRRWLEIVDHLAFAVATEHPDAIVERFRSYALVTGVEHGDEHDHRAARRRHALRGPPRAARALRLGADLRDRLAGARRAAARARGADRDRAATRPTVYRALGVPFVPPEVRDGTDELGTDWSDLVTSADVTTASHCHTTYSDGRHTIVEMARRRRRARLRRDHDHRSLGRGELRRRARRRQAARAGRRDRGARRRRSGSSRGTEADILADGTIDVPPELVRELDLVIASVHQRYKLDEDGDDERGSSPRCASRSSRSGATRSAGSCCAAIRSRSGSTRSSTRSPSRAPRSRSTAIRIASISIRSTRARRPRAASRSCCRPTRTRSAISQYVRWAVAMARRARIRKRQVLNTLPPDELAALIRPVS